MRRLNALVCAMLLLTLILHALSGSFLLLNIGGMRKTLSWTALLLAAAHASLSGWLSLPTIRALRRDALYLRLNARFWAVRASGIAILLLLVLHLGAFGTMRSGQFVLFNFTTVKLLAQIALVSALAVHLLAGIKPLLISLGVRGVRVRGGELLLALSLLLLFFAAALVIYYVEWHWR